MGEDCFAVISGRELCLIRVQTGQVDLLGASVQSGGAKYPAYLAGVG